MENYLQNYSIYIHIPFCKARCGYCAFCSCVDFSLCQNYFQKLYEQIDLCDYHGEKIYTVYVGGGTPSSVDVKYLEELFCHLRNKFDLSCVAEFTVECNPESATEQVLACLKNNGVTRLSFGLQSVNDATLKTIGRLHDYNGFVTALELAQNVGFDNVNADIIIGLPESERDFQHTVQTVANLPLTHVSAYALELNKGTKLYNLCNGISPFDDDKLCAMYDYTTEVLAQNGFSRYEISNFAKVGYECKHNLNYWRGGHYYAFGASACGYVGDLRFRNPYSVADYISTPTKSLCNIDETLTLADCADEYVMLGLRLAEGISLEYFRNVFGFDFWQKYPNARKLHSQGLLNVQADKVTVPSDKLYVINSILCELL